MKGINNIWLGRIRRVGRAISQAVELKTLTTDEARLAHVAETNSDPCFGPFGCKTHYDLSALLKSYAFDPLWQRPGYINSERDEARALKAAALVARRNPGIEVCTPHGSIRFDGEKLCRA